MELFKTTKKQQPKSPSASQKLKDQEVKAPSGEVSPEKDEAKKIQELERKLKYSEKLKEITNKYDTFMIQSKKLYYIIV